MRLVGVILAAVALFAQTTPDPCWVNLSKGVYGCAELPKPIPPAMPPAADGITVQHDGNLIMAGVKILNINAGSGISIRALSKDPTTGTLYLAIMAPGSGVTLTGFPCTVPMGSVPTIMARLPDGTCLPTDVITADGSKAAVLGETIP